MTFYVTKRLAESLIVLLVMSFAIYALMALMPGDPIDIMVQSDPHLTPADATRLKEIYGQNNCQVKLPNGIQLHFP